MDWNAVVLDYIYQHPHLAHWPDGKVVLGESESFLRVYPPATLPIFICQAAGGSPESAIPLAGAFVLLNLGSNIIDDYQDQDTAHSWTHWPLSRVTTCTLATIFLAQSCLARLEADDAGRREILDSFAEVGILAAVGQSLSPTGLQSIETYWRHAQAKSGVVHSAVSWSGARLANASSDLLQAAKEFGLALGTLIQIADDCQGVWDSAEGRSLESPWASLPVVMAIGHHNHPSHQKLIELLDQGETGSKGEWTQSICQLAIDIGGVTDALGIGKVYEQKALTALSAFDPERSAPLFELVRTTFGPHES